MISTDLSVVVPAKDEAPRLQETIGRLAPFVEALDAELVVAVDIGSTDDTVAIAAALERTHARMRVVPVLTTGKGNAVRTGVKAAAGDVVLMADADLAVDPSQFLPLVRAARTGAIAIASRSMEGAQRIGEPVPRYVLGRAFNLLVRALVLRGIRDSQCGFKAFPRAAGNKLLDSVEGLRWTFDVEFLALAARSGIPIVELPVRWTYGHGSKVRPAREARRVLSDVLSVRKRVGRVDATVYRPDDFAPTTITLSDPVTTTSDRLRG
ncbi:MAG TPA: glycosyltransferase [Actinomycetota bacterium]|nr:glycosyltransferase [Actinomycetota bacterium]